MRPMLKLFSNMKTRPATSFNRFAGKWKVQTVLQLNLTWNFLFSFDSKASYEPSWRTDICITENLMENITRCICPISGTFVVLLVKKSFNVGFVLLSWMRNNLVQFFLQQISPIKPPSVPMVVVICCGCCFLQSTIAFVVLLPNIYIRRCYISINFALMQFCLSVTATMSFIILSLLKFLPQVSFTHSNDFCHKKRFFVKANGNSIFTNLGKSQLQFVHNFRLYNSRIYIATCAC